MGMDYIPVYADEDSEPGTHRYGKNRSRHDAKHRGANDQGRTPIHGTLTIKAVGRVDYDENRLVQAPP